MVRLKKKILILMKKYFGPLGAFYLLREMKKLDQYDLDNFGDDEKMKLIRALIKNVFSKIYSPNRLVMVWSLLINRFELSKKKQEEVNEELKDLYLLSQ